ncbi:MAG TPA: general secretion pathway protein GspA, partial [Chloroflexi bacterium]|nr:general secretion pathway protein GspA [Chloroflexota bacterium]
MNKQHLTLFGLKFHPFRPGVPLEALMALPAVDSFCRRVEFSMGDGGYVMITGDPGTGKSVALRQLSHRLGKQRDVVVGTIDHPQSRVSDFYRELGDIFN